MTAALLFGHDKTVADWVASQAGGKPFSGDYAAFGFVTPVGRLVGGCVFTRPNEWTVELSLAGHAAATRSAWAAILDYVFGQSGASRMQMHTRRSNKRVTRIFAPRRKLGIRYEGVARRHYGDEDGIVYALTVDDVPAFRAKWRL